MEERISRCMEERISRFMLKAAKFEFYLISKDQSFARVGCEDRVILGVEWSKLAADLEERFRFDDFDFTSRGFQIFKETVPQSLVAKDGGGLKWDSENVTVSSWQTLLAQSYAQLRNNVAHGNKACLSAQFTQERTDKFLLAGHCLIQFIAEELFGDTDWCSPICFK